jgi:hypothetical protein
MHKEHTMRRIRILAPALVAAVAVALAGTGAAPRGGLEFSQARLIIEYNATDGDIGAQVFLDGEAWRKLWVFNPGGRLILDLTSARGLRMQGVTEFFFESSEPPLTQVPLEVFLRRFPAGRYQFSGITTQGQWISGAAEFTHVIPGAPEIVSPEEDAPQDPRRTVVAWNAVPDPPGSRIEAYQVTVTDQDQAFPKLEFSAVVPADVLRVSVPRQFLRAGRGYDFEVLAIETGGNQTITAGEFSTAP